MTELAFTLLRCAVALTVFARHGVHKIVDGWRYFVSGHTWPLLEDTLQLGLPLPVMMSVTAAMIQTIGAALLAAGAASRLSALAIAVTMATAALFNLQTGGSDGELAGLYALVTGSYVAAGGGPWSVDAWRHSRAHLEPQRR